MITLITPTGDRPISFNFAIDHMISQVTEEKIQWVVVDDGKSPGIKEIVKLRKPDIEKIGTIDYIQRSPKEIGPKSLAANLLTAIPLVRGDIVSIIEDDDWYSSLYLHDLVEKLDIYDATGTVWQCYYNLEHLTFKQLRNKGSALCSTSFRRHLLYPFEKVCRDCYDTNFKGIDYTFWKVLERDKRKILIDPEQKFLCVGMKSLPGRKGIGIGHEAKRFYPDPEAKKLCSWVGEKWTEIYLGVRNDMLRNRP